MTPLGLESFRFLLCHSGEADPRHQSMKHPRLFGAESCGCSVYWIGIHESPRA